jgi:hypothetical protein
MSGSGFNTTDLSGINSASKVYVNTNTTAGIKVASAKPSGTSTVVTTTKSQQSVKVATSNLFDISSPTDSSDSLVDLMFEDLAGQELINVSRHDSITGQNIQYHPIKNIASIMNESDPLKLIKLQGTDREYFESFPIDLSTHLPGIAGNVAFDSTNTNINISLINIEGYQVEVQFFTASSAPLQTTYS